MTNQELYSWVLRGARRIAIIKVMDTTMIPTYIRKKAIGAGAEISAANTSTVLRSFVKKGIAVCLNEEDRTGRLYQLTEKGKAIREEILKEENKSIFSCFFGFIGI